MNKQLLIHLKYCLTPTTRINNAAIVIDNDKILAVGGFSAFTHTEKYRVLEMTDHFAIPGMIDTHINGGGSFDCMHADTDTNVEMMSQMLAVHGTTSFVPTTQSAEHPKLLAVLKAWSAICKRKMPGAAAVGIHVDGPYISTRRSGAHPVNHIRPINMKEVEALIDAGAGFIKIMTFAPELQHAHQLIRHLREFHIIPAMGHTIADRITINRAIDAGAIRCTHLLNGMLPLRQRRVSLAAISMTDERMWVEIIVDGVHIHPRMIDLACRCIPKDKIVCISNATAAAGLKEGIYKFGDKDIVTRKGRSELMEGIIAGSTEYMDHNFYNMLDFSHLNECEVAACFTLNPARSIGLMDRGEIKPGKRADLTIMNKELEVQMTVVGGEIVYSKIPVESFDSN